MKSFGTILLSVTLLLLSCSGSSVGRPVRRAERVVAEADSLWRAGQAYGDSAQLAEAYRTLHAWRFFCPDEYAHSCYHYGRLLRSKDNPVAAMQCFIHATHSRTRDYHFLGRVYSNMGTLCHMASDFELSYDMYEKSANCFLSDHDTLSYNFVLNDMAYELAEQGDKENSLSLLDSISRQCTDNHIIDKVLETKAELYRVVEQYDSAIYYANQISSPYAPFSLCCIIKAQSYYRLGISDSAIAYANSVISDSLSSYKNKFNALYIVSHVDSTLDKNNLRDLASKREDIRFYEYEPQKEQLTLAIQTLKDDLDYVPDYRLVWIWGIICALCIGVLIFLSHKLRFKQKLIIIEKAKSAQRKLSQTNEIENRCQVLREESNLKEILHWKHYDEMCHIIDRQFFFIASKLKNVKTLNERDIQLCVLVLIGLSHADIANMMYIEEGSVGKLKERTAKKLQTSRKGLRKKLLMITLGE